MIETLVGDENAYEFFKVLNELSLDAEFALGLGDDVCLHGSIYSRLFTFE